MKTNKIIILTGIILLSSFVFVNAQQQDEKLTREMTLEREFDPTIQDANKINRLPEVREPAITRRTIEYSPFTIPANPDKEIIVLPSGDIMTAIPFNKRRGYFNFGGGMYMNLNGDLGYHLLNDEKDKLNVYFSHRSMNGDVEYLLEEKIRQKAMFNDNLGGIEYKHFFNPAVLRLGANYGYSMFNYYGLPFGLYKSEPPTSSLRIPYDDIMKFLLQDSLADRQTNQVNQTINAYAGIQSKEYARIGYILDFEYIRFFQKYGLAKEILTFNTDGIRANKYTLNLGLNSRFGDGNRLAGLAGKLKYFEYDYPGDTYPFVINDSLGYPNYWEATVTPYVRFEGDNWKAQLGVNLMMITGDSANYFLSPNITVEAEIADKTVFYVNALGEIRSNDPSELSKRNRYMDFSVMTKPSRTWLDATVGIRTGVVPDLWLDFFAGYRMTENEVFFIPSTLRGPLYNQFSSSQSASMIPAFSSFYTAYQPDVSHFHIGAALKYKYMNLFDFSVKGVYNQWSFSAGDDMPPGNYDWVKPFGRPAIEVNADLTIKPLNPLALTLDYYLGAERYTLLAGFGYYPDRIPYIYAETIQMKDIHDLNFTASWNFNKTVGAYLKLNNLLFQKQELYYGYPMQRFHGMVGINLNF